MSDPTKDCTLVRCPFSCEGYVHVCPYAAAAARGECQHEDTWFDRTVCPEPCGSMHTICSDCSEILDGGCVLDAK